MMATLYPGGLDTFTTKTDGVDNVLAAHMNDVQLSIVAIQTELGINVAGVEEDLIARLDQNVAEADNADITVLSGNQSLNNIHGVIQNFDPGGSSRDIELPAEGSSNHVFIIMNIGSAGENLVMNDDSPATILTIEPNEVGLLIPDGITWRGVLMRSVGPWKITGADARLRLVDDDDGSGTSYLEIDDGSQSTGSIKKVAVTGVVVLDIDVITSAGTATATIRVFRSTNTSGDVTLQFFKGDGSATKEAQIGVAGAISFIGKGGGDFGVGSSANPTANGGFVLYFADNSADPTMDTNTAGLFGKDVAGTVEMQAVDEGGAVTQLTSHYKPDEMEVHKDVKMPTHTLTSHNLYTGEKITYDIHALALAIEQLSDRRIIYREELPGRRDWEKDQAVKVEKQEERIRDWEERESARPAKIKAFKKQEKERPKLIEKWNALSDKEKEKTPYPKNKLEYPLEMEEKPLPLTPKEKPKWLK